jgi:hypothetical protein
MVPSATPLRILPSILTAEKFRPDEIQGIGRRLMKRFGVPAVLQKHILSCRFVTPAQLAVVTKHFLSESVHTENVSGEEWQYRAIRVLRRNQRNYASSVIRSLRSVMTLRRALRDQSKGSGSMKYEV